MKLFQSFQKNAAQLGIISNQTQKAHPFNTRNVLCLILIGFASISNIFFLFNVEGSIGDNMYSVYMATMTTGVFLCYSIVVWKLKRVFEFIDGIEETVNKQAKAYPIGKTSAVKTDEQNEKLSEFIYFVIVKVSSPYLVVPKFFYSFFRYFTNGFDNDAFILPIPTWLPFDWKNPIGYMCASSLQYVIGLCMFFIIASLLSIGFGAFLFAIWATKMITGNLESANECTKSKKDQVKISQYLSDVIQFHANVKKLLHIYLDVFQPNFMIILFWCICTICGALLMFQMQMSQHEYHGLLETAFEAFYAFGLAFVPCELGERLTSAFDHISVVIERLDWYIYPHGIQNMLPIIINVAHQPVVLDCFGSTACLRESFKKVVNCGFSYFMILRHFLK